jgi:hypothetical protein
MKKLLFAALWLAALGAASTAQPAKPKRLADVQTVYVLPESKLDAEFLAIASTNVQERKDRAGKLQKLRDARRLVATQLSATEGVTALADPDQTPVRLLLNYNYDEPLLSGTTGSRTPPSYSRRRVFDTGLIQVTLYVAGKLLWTSSYNGANDAETIAKNVCRALTQAVAKDRAKQARSQPKPSLERNQP